MKKWMRLGATLLALAVAAACLVWVRLAQTPLPQTDLSPATHPELWRFSLIDGTPLTPGPDGGLEVPDGETVYCVTTLPELGGLAPLELGAGRVEAALLLDGKLAADPSGRFTPEEGFSKPPPEQAASAGRFDLNHASGQTLTLAVQFLGPSANLNALPSVVVFTEQLYYDSCRYTEAASAALPAGVFLTVGLLLIALALFQYWWGRRDWDMVFLALASLSFALGESFRYSHYVLAVLKLAALLSFVNVLPALALLWLLWQHTTGLRKQWGLLLPLSVTAALLLTLLNVLPLTWWTMIQGKCFPLALCGVLALGVWEAVRTRSWFRRFYLLTGGLLGAGVLWCGGYYLLLGALWPPLATALSGLSWGSFFLLANLLCFPLLVAALLSAVIEWLHAEVSRRTEARLLVQRGELAQSSYEALRRQNEQVMMLRHDMVKHFQVLRQTTADEKTAAYLDELIGENERIRPVVQSGNEMLDVILNGKLSAAADAGIAVELVRTQAPAKLPLTDAELCSLVMNLLDNALAGASASGVERPYIKLDLCVKQHFFMLSCENSTTMEHIQKETAPGHGLGVKIIKQIVARYDDLLETEYGADYYSVKLAIPLD